MSGEPKKNDGVSLLAVAVAGAIVSLVATGYVFPKNNNLFYYAVISDLPSDPSLKNDVFVESLNHFASGLWLALRGSPNAVDPYWLFFALDVLSRILTFAGALACADLLGVKTLAQRLVFSLIFAASFLMSHYALAGAGGLFIDNFTHTEVDNGLFLICLALAVSRRIGAAVAVLGAMAFVNVFFAVWTVAPLAAIVALQLRRGETRLPDLVVPVAVGGAVATALALPVALSVIGNRGYGATPDFDYVAFLRDYFPYHFLFGSISLLQRVGLVAIASAALLSLALLGGSARYFAAAVIGAVAVYAVGVAVPAFTHSQAILNLHLLRSSVLFHLLCAVAASALAVRWLFAADGVGALCRGFLLAVVLTVPTFAYSRHNNAMVYPALAALLAVTAWGAATARRAPSVPDRRSPPTRVTNAARAALAAWLALSVGTQAITAHAAQRAEQAWIADWRRVAAWARANTPPGAVFLTPVEQGRENSVFDAEARRAVWVDWKHGAAVMWQPAYYPVWRKRMDETAGLDGLAGKLAYAASRNIGYVVDLCALGEGGGAARVEPAFAAGSLCVWDVGSARRGAS